MMDNRMAIELYLPFIHRIYAKNLTETGNSGKARKTAVHRQFCGRGYSFINGYRTIPAILSLTFSRLFMIPSATGSTTPSAAGSTTQPISGRINLEIPDTEGNKRWENKFTRPHNGFTASGLFWRGSIIAHWRLPTDGFNRFHFPLMLCTESRGILPS